MNLKSSSLTAIAAGCGLAGMWYGAAKMLLSGPVAETLPALGAIAIAGCAPTIIRKRGANRQFADSRLSMAQRLETFDKHVCINTVNENDLLTEVNDRLLDLIGYTRDELIGTPVKDLFDDAARPLAGEIRSCLRRGACWEGETPLRHKNGHVVYTQSTIMPLFDAKGEWAGSISVRTDVSHTNELIAERHTAQTLYELRDDIWIVDAGSEVFNYMNRAAEQRIALLGANYVNRTLEEFSETHNTVPVLEACRQLRAEGRLATQFDTDLFGIPAAVSIKFLPDAGVAGRYLILFTDISERVEQEKQKTAFVSTVSHELRSPLTSIKGAMGLLLSRSAGELPDKAVSLLEIAHRNADRLVLIINDILDLDKMANGQMDFDLKDVDLADLIVETQQANLMLQERFGVVVKLDGLGAPLALRTDPNRLIQVMNNLLSNACKFSRPDTEIVISAEDRQDHVQVSITDQGTGIPEEEQHKIFNRFADMANSDRAAKGGTGLGLSICKAIIDQLGGTIDFETTPDVGTTFYIRLPKAGPTDIPEEQIEYQRSA